MSVQGVEGEGAQEYFNVEDSYNHSLGNNNLLTRRQDFKTGVLNKDFHDDYQVMMYPKIRDIRAVK